ncbi:MAG TPA: CPBP family intramembrane glutamic endopeptidase [Solirubrobacteraceae bacterium]|nr:CPBP family intramembrane glutamic endopeptidase [Solirubrobacteraceae bacterium]
MPDGAPGGGESSRGGGEVPDPSRGVIVDWPPWMAPVALIGGLVLAAVSGLVVDIPALVLGVKITTSHTPPGIAIADTFVQDVAFVLAAVYCARLGGRAVRAWQFGLRPPRSGWRSAAGMIALLIVAFLLLNVIWQELFNPGKEKILEQLGSNENAALLLLSAALTCIVAPVSEEFLFRGFIFTALRNWRGTLPAAVITGLLFGGVHAGSAPVLDLVPLAGLGFGLCLLYRYTGSLYPSIVSHSLNNSVAFASLEGWSWPEFVVLIAGSLAGIGALVFVFKRLGVIGSEAMPVMHSP